MSSSVHTGQAAGDLLFTASALGIALAYKESTGLHNMLNDYLWTAVLLVTLSTALLNCYAAWRRVLRERPGRDRKEVSWVHYLKTVWHKTRPPS